jgi:hypothetical protein
MKHAGKLFGLLALSTFMSLPAFAQSAGSQQENNTPQQQEKTNAQQADGTAARTRKSVTGCLQKGDKTGSFSIKTDNGATWILRSRKVDLSEHVGHQVTASGFLAQKNQTAQSPSTPNTTVDNAQDSSGAGGAGTINALHVTTVKMVSETCPSK